MFMNSARLSSSGQCSDGSGVKSTRVFTENPFLHTRKNKTFNEHYHAYLLERYTLIDIAIHLIMFSHGLNRPFKGAGRQEHEDKVRRHKGNRETEDRKTGTRVSIVSTFPPPKGANI